MQVGHRRRANEAGYDNPSTQMSEPVRLSTLGADIERDERKLKELKQTHGTPMRVQPQVSSFIGNQMQHTRRASKSPAFISGPYPAPLAAPSTVPFTGPPALQSQPQPQKLPLPIAHRKRIGDEVGYPLQQYPLPSHPSAQQHPYGFQQGYFATQNAPHGYHPHGHPQQLPPQGFQTQQATGTHEAQRRINENYDRYTQQNSGRKSRKRPDEILGNDGRVTKNKQRMVTKTSEMRFGGLRNEKLLQEQHKLLADAELRANEERAARQMEAIEQEEAKLRAEDEQFARQRELHKRKEREG